MITPLRTNMSHKQPLSEVRTPLERYGSDMIARTDGQGDSYSGWDTPLLGLYQYIDTSKFTGASLPSNIGCTDNKLI